MSRTVYILNDHEQGARAKTKIESLLNAKFQEEAVISFAVLEPDKPVDLRSTTDDSVADQFLTLNPAPDVLLIDCNMPDPGDAIRMVDILRRRGFVGFAYLWSAASPEADLQSQPAMFAPPGAGGFRNPDELEKLVDNIYNSWKALGDFKVANPEHRGLRSPLTPALQVLSELQAGLFAWQHAAQKDKDEEAHVEWRRAARRAEAAFKSGPDSFSQTIRYFAKSPFDLATANNELEELLTISSSNFPAIEKSIARLRDELLRIVELCR